MKEKILEKFNSLLAFCKKYYIVFITFAVLITFAILTFMTLVYKEDSELIRSGEERVSGIDGIRFDAKTLDTVQKTPNPATVQGQSGKNPFMPF